MSGIYIPGMEMPKNCLACDWCAHTIPADNYICYRLNRAVIGVAKEDVDETVNACCPLVPVPEHGRLIDADALIEKDNKDYEIAMEALMSVTTKSMIMRIHEQMQAVISDSPTIIPADHIGDVNEMVADKEGEG